jgi:uncharacterized protein YqgC (DUF456 family)
METTALVLAILLFIAGLVGTILPVLPGCPDFWRHDSLWIHDPIRYTGCLLLSLTGHSIRFDLPD